MLIEPNSESLLRKLLSWRESYSAITILNGIDTAKSFDWFNAANRTKIVYEGVLR